MSFYKLKKVTFKLVFRKNVTDICTEKWYSNHNPANLIDTGDYRQFVVDISRLKTIVTA